jgi:hypothetical protein
MGVFFGPRLRPAVTAATNQTVSEVDGPGSVQWVRLGLAAGLLVALLAGTIITAFYPETRDLHPILLHSFELLLGAVVGMVTGEAIGRRA